jgi:hypothetical protein
MKKSTSLGLSVIALSAVSAFAQANPYGLNVAGYCNLTVPANSQALIANPLYTGTNTLGCLIPNPPPGSQFFKFRPNGGFIAYTFDKELKWTPDGDVTLYPGEGGFFKNPTASPVTLSFTGEVLSRDLTNTVPAGIGVYSAPQAGRITTDLGFPASPGDRLSTYGPAGYTAYVFDEAELRWTPSEPVIHQGQAFFCQKKAPGVWVRKAVTVR